MQINRKVRHARSVYLPSAVNFDAYIHVGLGYIAFVGPIQLYTRTWFVSSYICIMYLV